MSIFENVKCVTLNLKYYLRKIQSSFFKRGNDNVAYAFINAYSVYPSNSPIVDTTFGKKYLTNQIILCYYCIINL